MSSLSLMNYSSCSVPRFPHNVRFCTVSSPEMVSSMKAVASLDVELTVEERNLLSVAYKNVIGARRASWRIVSSIEQKEENKAAEDKLKLIRTYREKVRALHSRRIL